MQDAAEKVGIRQLLEAGVHFGHQAKRWNPKMKKYIFAERTGVHIIDLDQTLDLLDRAIDFVRSIAEARREVLFVGTKKQAQITLAEEALRCGMPYVAERYIGGMLTNFQTIKPRIEYFKDLSERIDATPEEDRSGKEWFALNREYQKLRRNFAGLTEMERLPGAVFVVDPKREELLVKEANRLKIPVVALTDTNCDPEVVDYIIPGNDDAIRSISLISRLISDAIIEGRGEEFVPSAERPLPPVAEEAEITFDAAPGLSQENGSGEETPSAASAGASTNGNGSATPQAAPETATAQPGEEAEMTTESIDDREKPTAPDPEEAVREESETKTGEVVSPEEASGQVGDEEEEGK
ncbi:ribosomal protein S2 [Rubrobacter radiotolerans]|uniref:Small ribosomal subunit protein uS2 n=1 Tax=Rubrobacter radiotolerans TaxID=42256 RepID=A0A023X2J9_RUBRA|nr:30S ribosomal protein S2 [Rubrobacter radiotolerans]AHY46687.1 ribosomal protein S2 [Rubrobacter radiotolerans]MDX5894094.1 30S ribosomal protein S2 [Rubrobacter radiotolerans]SMC05181.1 SSU ribosomal protein S2P [Rubrobacter radiotolerans DSM 5868]